MMPWWSWLVIWAALVLGMLAVLGLSAWWLFRKFVVLTNDLSDLFELTEALDIPQSEHMAPALAVLADLKDVQLREEARKAHRAQRGWRARQRRLERARALTLVDASQIRWPEAWYAKPVRKPK